MKWRSIKYDPPKADQLILMKYDDDGDYYYFIGYCNMDTYEFNEQRTNLIYEPLGYWINLPELETTLPKDEE